MATKTTPPDAKPSNPLIEAFAQIEELQAAIVENEALLQSATTEAIDKRNGFKAPTSLSEAQARANDRPDSRYAERQAAFVEWSKDVKGPMQATISALRKSLSEAKASYSQLRNQFEAENLDAVTEQAVDSLNACRTHERTLKSKLDGLQADMANWRAAATGLQAEMTALEMKQAKALISGGDFDEAEFARLAAEVLATQRKVKAAETAHADLKRQHQQARDSTRAAEIELSRLQRVAAMNSARALIEPLFNSGLPLWAIRDALAADHRLSL